MFVFGQRIANDPPVAVQAFVETNKPPILSCSDLQQHHLLCFRFFVCADWVCGSPHMCSSLMACACAADESLVSEDLLSLLMVTWRDSVELGVPRVNKRGKNNRKLVSQFNPKGLLILAFTAQQIYRCGHQLIVVQIQGHIRLDASLVDHAPKRGEVMRGGDLQCLVRI